jgi:DNA-3-methyladenine glycosylase II
MMQKTTAIKAGAVPPRANALPLPRYWRTAARELARRDAVLRVFIGRCQGLPLRSRGDAFQTLARAIVGQQISVKAAQSVWKRLAAQLTAVTPAGILRARSEALRQCGLSRQKALYLHDLARHFADGVLEVSSWRRLDDEALIADLTRVKGIGRWTAEMFLIFFLARPDVLPLDDLGLKRAMNLHYGRGRLLTRSRMRNIGAGWAPWRSVATWYLWRSLDPVAAES